MQYMKRSFLLFSLILLSTGLTLNAQELEEGDYLYTIDFTEGVTATIIGFNLDYSGALTITNTLGGLTVTRIDFAAFYGCTGITSVSISDSITSIDEWAFGYCIGMTNVWIGRCVADLHRYSFVDCSSLVSIHVDPLNSSFNSVNGVVFNKAQTVLLSCPAGKVGSYAIPEGVTMINESAFAGCAWLTSIMIPESVASIGITAFSRCAGLTSVSIPNSVTSIGSWAFELCHSLTNVFIPECVTNIGDGVFGSCANLTAINVDGQNPVYSSTNGVMFDKAQTTLVQYPAGNNAGVYIIPDSVTCIAWFSFYSSIGLTNIIISESVTNMGWWAFSGCTGLTSVSIPNSVTSIGQCVFDNCTGLTEVTIPDSVTNIHGFAFYFCSGLTSIRIPESVASIGRLAFGQCTGLTSVFFDGNMPDAGEDVFYNSDHVTVCYLPGATGWGATFADRPALLWNPTFQGGDGCFGVSNNCFGFSITGTTNIPVVVKACTNLLLDAWVTLMSTNLTDGSFYFSDQQWTNYPAQFYRVCPP